MLTLAPERPKSKPEAILLEVLSQPDADARVAEALPWVVRRYAGQMDFRRLSRQAKLRDLQNRMGFVLEAAGTNKRGVAEALGDLEGARLLRESTLCWDSMPAATRQWMRTSRSSRARHWNMLSMLETEGKLDAA